MKNLAGVQPEITDFECEVELTSAGIPVWEELRCLRNTGEVKSSVRGLLNGWKFERAWYYWVARWEPPSPVVLTMEKAIELHKTHGKEVRVSGHCGCPAPDEYWNKNGTPHLYHIDTVEGLKAFATTIS